MRISILLALACVSLLVPTLPSPGAASERRQSLGFLNHISVADSRRIPVRLNETATLSGKLDASNPDIDVQGDGRLVGFVLTQDIPSRLGVTLVAGRVAFCGSPGCDVPDDGGNRFLFAFQDPSGKSLPRTVTLPAGDYVLYAFADAAPVRLTLRLHGLSGTRRLSSRDAQPIKSRLVEPPTRLSTAPLNTTYSAGATGTLSRRGMMFTAMRIRADAWAAGQYGDCLYRGRPPEDTPFPYGPNCPFADASFRTDDAFVRPFPSSTGFYGVTLAPAGRWSQGIWHNGAAVVKDVDGLVSWLSFT